MGRERTVNSRIQFCYSSWCQDISTIITNNYAIFWNVKFGTKRVDNGESLHWQMANALNIDFVNLCTETI